MTKEGEIIQRPMKEVIRTDGNAPKSLNKFNLIAEIKIILPYLQQQFLGETYMHSESFDMQPNFKFAQFTPTSVRSKCSIMSSFLFLVFLFALFATINHKEFEECETVIVVNFK